MTDDQKWGQVISEQSKDAHVENVIEIINRETAAGRLNRADVVVACAQMLGYTIANAGGSPNTVPIDIRLGILALIDGYAMEFATEE